MGRRKLICFYQLSRSCNSATLKCLYGLTCRALALCLIGKRTYLVIPPTPCCCGFWSWYPCFDLKFLSYCPLRCCWGDLSNRESPPLFGGRKIKIWLYFYFRRAVVDIPIQTLIFSSWPLFRKMIILQMQLGLPNRCHISQSLLHICLFKTGNQSLKMAVVRVGTSD